MTQAPSKNGSKASKGRVLLTEIHRLDLFVCFDACFSQKRNKTRGARDPEKFHPKSSFVPEHLVLQMETYVDALRKSKPRKKTRVTTVKDEASDDYEHEALKIPPSVQDRCEASFKAADERREKASTQFFDDTGLMGCLCRHDQILFLVNMRSAGEKQFYFWLLAEMLFQHLPTNIHVGMLYDIGCSVERSARKWGFLNRFMNRVAFAVSIFHAFGHEWACQLIYHPRKREGFGFTNGEGCERFWNLISHLVAHLRVMSVSFIPFCFLISLSDPLFQYHHRLYTLDTQIQHIQTKSLITMAEWNKRRSLHSLAMRAEATTELELHDFDEQFLREQWKLQVQSQTKPRPRMFVLFCIFQVMTFPPAGASRTEAQKAVNTIVALRDVQQKQQTLVETQKAALQEATDNGNANAISECSSYLESAESLLQKTTTSLRLKESTLGVEGHQQLQEIAGTKYLELRVKQHRLKLRLQELVRSRKFEQSALERASRRHEGSGGWI
jgi:hypothetical protein